MSTKEVVLKAMREAGKPLSAGEVQKLTGIDRKEIDKAFKELKKEQPSYLRYAVREPAE